MLRIILFENILLGKVGAENRGCGITSNWIHHSGAHLNKQQIAGLLGSFVRYFHT